MVVWANGRYDRRCGGVRVWILASGSFGRYGRVSRRLGDQGVLEMGEVGGFSRGRCEDVFLD